MLRHNRVRLQTERSELMMELADADRELHALATRRIEVIGRLDELRDELWPRSGHRAGRQPPDAEEIPLPPVLPEAIEVWGRGLRACCRAILRQHGRLPLRSLHALLHHYFGDKVGLFRAVVQNAFAGVSTRALAALRSGSSIRSLLETYVNMLIDFHAQNPNLVRLLHYASLDASSPAFAAMEEVTREISAPVMEAVGHAVEAAQHAKVIRQDIDARRLLSLSIGAVAYVFHEDRFFTLFHGGEVRAPESVEAHRQAALAFLLTAVFP